MKTFQLETFYYLFSVPYRSDSDSKGDGILLYVREDIPSNLLTKEEKKADRGFLCQVKFT